jgi:hypothetical protein
MEKKYFLILECASKKKLMHITKKKMSHFAKKKFDAQLPKKKKLVNILPKFFFLMHILHENNN